MLAEIHRLSAHDIDDHKASAQSHGTLDGIRKAFLDARPHHQTVHDDLYIVLDILVQPDLLGQLILIAVYAGPDISAFSGLVQHLHMLALAPPHHRRQQLDPGLLRHGQDLIHHLIHGLSADLLAALGTVGNTDPGIEKTHIVIDLCHRPHCGAGITVGGFLVNGDGRGKAFDTLHIRLLHLPQKLSRIGGQRLHIPSLALRIDGVKSQR